MEAVFLCSFLEVMEVVKVHVGPHEIHVTGHAPRADNIPPGQNIVCAAVSALTLTLIEGLAVIAVMCPKTEEAPGDVRICWTECNEIGKALIDTWFIGINRIRESYENTIMII